MAEVTMPTKINRIVKPTYSKREANVEVKILRTGRYSDFSVPPKVGAKVRREGEVVEFPGYYAESIIASGHADPFSEPDVTGAVEVTVTETVKAKPKPRRKRSTKKE